MTALVIIITGSYIDPSNAEFIANNQGGALTSAAMGSVIPCFHTFCPLLFFYSLSRL